MSVEKHLKTQVSITTLSGNNSSNSGVDVAEDSNESAASNDQQSTDEKHPATSDDLQVTTEKQPKASGCQTWINQQAADKLELTRINQQGKTSH